MASFHVSLRNRIYLLLTGILLITFSGGFVLVWYTYSMQDLLAAHPRVRVVPPSM